jgi:hypothetical protein
VSNTPLIHRTCPPKHYVERRPFNRGGSGKQDEEMARRRSLHFVAQIAPDRSGSDLLQLAIADCSLVGVEGWWNTMRRKGVGAKKYLGLIYLDLVGFGQIYLDETADG